MKSFRNKIHAAWISALSLLGVYQYQRPPTLDHNPTPTEIADTISQASPTPSPVASSTPIPTPAPVALSGKPQMVLTQIKGATDAEIVQIKKGVELANAVLASDWFKTKVLAENFTETNIWDSDVELSNEQIYNHIAEKPIQVAVQMFYGTWRQNYIYKTMGYDIGDGVTYMNRFYVSTAPVMGSLQTHEAEGHGQGFHHYGVFATSIPYKWNDLIEEGYKVLNLIQ